VPNLAKSLRRVYFENDLTGEAGKNLAAGIKMLQDDHQNGARVLAGTALLVLGDVVEVLQSRTAAAWWEDARIVAWHLWKNGRESMGAAILNVMICALEILERDVLPQYEELTQSQLEQAIRSRLDAFGETRMPFYKAISRQFQAYLNENLPIDRPVRVLTLSSSSTIVACLKDAIRGGDHHFDFRVLESRPLFEGATMAASLATDIKDANSGGNSQQHQLTVYTDACAGIASRDVDLVLLGADLISAKGDVCNKTGSLAAVLCARHISPNVKVAVVADSEKIFPFEAPAAEENHESEVTGAWNAFPSSMEAATALTGTNDGVNPATSVKNVYFEWVPSDFITIFILENGNKNVLDIEVIVKSVQEKANRLFDDL
jgi:translation initiation factor 2B subunit (eIF-2B alpha/beta/delta family)